MWIHTRTEPQHCAVHSTMVLGLCLWIWWYATPLAEKRQTKHKRTKTWPYTTWGPQSHADARAPPAAGWHVPPCGVPDFSAVGLTVLFTGLHVSAYPEAERRISPSALQQRRVGGQVSMVGATLCQTGSQPPTFRFLRSPLQYTTSSQTLAAEELTLQ